MIFIGKIVRVRGNKGEVIVASPDARAYTLKAGEAVVLQSEKYQRQYNIENLREVKRALVIKLVDINTISEALKLVGYSIYMHDFSKENSEKKNKKLEDFIVKDINGQLWGKVKNMEANNTNNLLEVHGENENDNHIYYVPFTDDIIKEINNEKRIILIDPPNGLKDLNKK